MQSNGKVWCRFRVTVRGRRPGDAPGATHPFGHGTAGALSDFVAEVAGRPGRARTSGDPRSTDRKPALVSEGGRIRPVYDDHDWSSKRFPSGSRT